MKFTLLSLLGILTILGAGCSYPKLQIHKLDELTFENKRLEGNTRAIQEFIKPEQIKEVLGRLTLQDFSSHKEENITLNVLDYVQRLKQTKDRKEFWQYPEETIAKGGDCEDKTFLLLSMLIQAGIEEAQGVKGRCLGKGHMWVEYKGYILDPSKKIPKLIPIKKSTGYSPHFKFDRQSSYFCKIERR